MSKLDNLKWRKTYIKESGKDAKVTRTPKSEDKAAEPNSVVPAIAPVEEDAACDSDVNGNSA